VKLDSLVNKYLMFLTQDILIIPLLINLLTQLQVINQLQPITLQPQPIRLLPTKLVETMTSRNLILQEIVESKRKMWRIFSKPLMCKTHSECE